MSIAPPPDVPRHDVRMDGVYFVRASAGAASVKALTSGSFSYCFMVRRGRLQLETDFPIARTLDLGPGDAVAFSGLAPHVFRCSGASVEANPGAFDLRPVPTQDPGDEVDIFLGVAPSEALALGSLIWGANSERNCERRAPQFPLHSFLQTPQASGGALASIP